MIIPRTLLRIIDNSGAKVCRVIRLLSQCKTTKLGDLAVVSLKKVKPKKIVKGKKSEILKKGEIRLALIIITKKPQFRKDGSALNISDNYAVLVSPKGKALGTRYKIPLPRELRSQKWVKLISIAPSLI